MDKLPDPATLKAGAVEFVDEEGEWRLLYKRRRDYGYWADDEMGQEVAVVAHTIYGYSDRLWDE